MYLYNQKLKNALSAEGKNVIVLDADLGDRFKENGLVGALTIHDIIYMCDDVSEIVEDAVEVVKLKGDRPNTFIFALAVKKEEMKNVVRDNLPPATKLSERGNRVWSY